MGLNPYIPEMKAELKHQRDQLLEEINASGKWDATKYEELRTLNTRLEIPDPDEPELDLKPEVKPKKGR